jgi:hypothetical protein
MADQQEQKVKIIDLNALKKYDALIKEWFKSQIVYAVEQDILDMFDTETTEKENS